MEDWEILERLTELRKGSVAYFPEFQQTAKLLVGHDIIFVRGTRQNVFARVVSYVPCSIRVVVQNFLTLRKYELDVSKVKFIKVTKSVD